MTSRHSILGLLVLSLVCIFAIEASGAVISVSPTAPTVDRFDIAQLNGTTDPGGDQGHIWADRPVQGQIFTTSTNRDGYLLHAITLKNLSTTTTGGAFTVRVGTVNDNTFSLPAKRSAIQATWELPATPRFARAQLSPPGANLSSKGSTWSSIKPAIRWSSLTSKPSTKWTSSACHSSSAPRPAL